MPRSTQRSGPPADRSRRPPPTERADKVRNRERILEAAAAAFAEQGLEAPMDDVAARAGLAVGTLYRHYATKDALMAAIVEHALREIVELTRQAIAREHDEPFEVLSDVLRQRIAAVSANRAAKSVLFGSGDAVPQRLAEVRAEARATLQVLVDRAHAAGALRDDVGIDEIWTASCGVVAVMDDHPTPWQRHLQLFLDGMRARAELAPAASSL